MIARIVKIVSKDYTIQFEDGHRENAIVMGKVRLQEAPLAGDFVRVEDVQGQWVIQEIMERKNRLRRPAVANVDQAMIVMSVKDPDFSTTIVDRLSILICYEEITPILCVTKCDLGISDEVEEWIQEYERGPMQVLRTKKDALSKDLASVLEGKVTVLTGQSGAGKSTLLNELEPSFQLKTQEISQALGRGKHTTRHNELHVVAGGLVADTPGFSSVDFSHIEADELGECVLDFEPYIGKCRFNDCIHQNEPDCAIKEAVEKRIIPKSRYENYLGVLQLIKERKAKYI